MLMWATPGTQAISCAASTPRAVSIAGTSGRPPARAATHSTSSADSHFGIRIAAACGANALAVAVPCNRVLRSDGALSGYRWGVERKRALLDREAGR